jgi:hypothetical protein
MKGIPMNPRRQPGQLLFAAFAACYFSRPFLDPAADSGAGLGAGGGGSAEAADDDGPLVVQEEATPAPAAATPAAAAPVDPPLVTEPAAAVAPAAAEIVTPAASPPVTPQPAMDKAVQQLQQEMGNVTRTLGEFKDVLAEVKRLRDELAAGKAAGTTPTPAQVQQADELEQMIADTYEVDVNETPKKLAKAMLDLRKQMQDNLEKLRADTSQDRQARAAADGQREFDQLQAQVRAKQPAADLTVVYRDAAQKAADEGFGRYGADALRHRATQLFQAEIDRLLAIPAPAVPPAVPPAAAAAAPAAAPVPPKTAPAVPPITPGGAQARIPNTGGSPRPAPSVVPSEDEIYDRHTLVKQ